MPNNTAPETAAITDEAKNIGQGLWAFSAPPVFTSAATLLVVSDFFAVGKVLALVLAAMAVMAFWAPGVGVVVHCQPCVVLAYAFAVMAFTYYILSVMVPLGNNSCRESWSLLSVILVCGLLATRHP